MTSLPPIASARPALFDRLAETWRVWTRVYQRIRFARKMYPLPAILQDAVLFPIDYLIDGRNIRTVRNLTVAITRKCNIRCEMCYFWKELDDKNSMSFETYRKIVDQAAPTRPCVILTGGEPMSHPNVVDMVEYAKGKGLPVQIFTNGTLVKPAMADRLTNAGLDYINFTLLGNEETHPLVARAKGSYRMFVENLEYLSAHRGQTAVLLNYTITPTSYQHMGHAVELARRFKLDGIRYQHYNFLRPGECAEQEKVMRDLFGIDSSANDVEFSGDIASMATPLKAFIAWTRRETGDLSIGWAPTLTDAEIDNWYSDEPFQSQRKCLYMWRGVTVDAKNTVMPCNKIYLDMGDVTEGDLLDLWNCTRMKEFRRLQKNQPFPACARCCKL